ncbi:hypothetical protein [Luteipulveratus halotolerans]|uniref:hypothetical protein n=1 Tax=Luteipulveratus halotolerans TaxID=1631356 RepID=UPI0012FAB621|nr:hypothetical protein [Luteipulveratus halotolerans]
MQVVVGVLSLPLMAISFGMFNVIREREIDGPWDAVASILGLVGLVTMGAVNVQRSRAQRRLSPGEEHEMRLRQRRGARGWVAASAVGGSTVAALVLPPMLSDLPVRVALALPVLLAIPLVAFVAVETHKDLALEAEIRFRTDEGVGAP